MKLFKRILVISLIFSVYVQSAVAHFGMVIPSDNMVMPDDERTVQLSLSFSHPFEMIGMTLEKPRKITLVHPLSSKDLSSSLEASTVMGHPSWTLNYTVKKPGAHWFVMEPTPYWEPSEDAFIIHYTKTMIAAFGDDEGWDSELGLKTEIVPLSKPFGLYAGNLFQGIVKLDGKPVPFAEVEVEYYNQKKSATAPNDYMITQTIKADGNGVFSYATPTAGWWGFAALSSSDEKLKYKDQLKDVELGAVLWVKFEKWMDKK